MNQSDPFSLDRLEDIVTPEPVSWWPPAPFWYCVIAVAALWMLYGLIAATCRWLQNAYRRQALKELSEIQADFALSVSSILKRVALVSFPKQQVASLAGQDWVRFLNETCEGVDFSQQPVCMIATASSDPHQSLTESDCVQLVAEAQKWVAHHRVETTHD